MDPYRPPGLCPAATVSAFCKADGADVKTVLCKNTAESLHFMVELGQTMHCRHGNDKCNEG